MGTEKQMSPISFETPHSLDVALKHSMRQLVTPICPLFVEIHALPAHPPFLLVTANLCLPLLRLLGAFAGEFSPLYFLSQPCLQVASQTQSYTCVETAASFTFCIHSLSALYTPPRRCPHQFIPPISLVFSVKTVQDNAIQHTALPNTSTLITYAMIASAPPLLPILSLVSMILTTKLSRTF